MDKEITITNCNNCPFCNNDNESGYSCNFPFSEALASEMTDYDKDIAPEKCPLRVASFTISLG